MRILHTADWHLGDRLGRIDRTDDLRRAVERVAGYCTSEKVDVLLVAGDLFSELAGPEGLRDAIRHLQEAFGGFLPTAAPSSPDRQPRQGELLSDAAARHAPRRARRRPARRTRAARPAHLATGPTCCGCPIGRPGQSVQFVLMPYPTPTRYLTEEADQAYQGFDEKNRNLMRAFTGLAARRAGTRRISTRRCPPSWRPHRHAGQRPLDALPPHARRKTSFRGASLLDGFAYVALGHIHQPQFLGGRPHVRYCGSIERLDLGERTTTSASSSSRSARGDARQPTILPLEATPIYDVEILSPKAQIAALEADYPTASVTLVRIRCTYTAGVDNREETLRRAGGDLSALVRPRDHRIGGRWVGRCPGRGVADQAVLRTRSATISVRNCAITRTPCATPCWRGRNGC